MPVRSVVVCDRCLELADWEFAQRSSWSFPRAWSGSVPVSDRLRLVPPDGLHAVTLCPRCADERDRFGGLAGAGAALVLFLTTWGQIRLSGWAWAVASLVLLGVCAGVVGPLVARAARALEDLWMRTSARDRVRRHMVTNHYDAWPVLTDGMVRHDDRPRLQGRLVSDEWLAAARARDRGPS